MARITLTQRLEKLRNQFAKNNGRKKSTEPIHREMVRLKCRQIRKEIREERRAAR